MPSPSPSSAIDLIMALDPDWFSTLFGGWYFIGNLFSGLALLAIAAMSLRNRCGLQRFLPEARQSDLATLLFAFCLLNIDFFWSQYLTIWYGNLPEETGWLIERAVDDSAALGQALLGQPERLLHHSVRGAAVPQGQKQSRAADRPCRSWWWPVSSSPASSRSRRRCCMSSRAPGCWTAAGRSGCCSPPILLFAGCVGVGGFFYYSLLTKVPILPIGDEVFTRECGSGEHAA